MYCESPDHKQVNLDPEDLQRKAKAASVAKCGDESEWKLQLLAELALAEHASRVAVSLKSIATDARILNGQSGAGPSTSKEIREAGDPEAIAKAKPEEVKRGMIKTPPSDSEWHYYLELSMRNPSSELDAEEDHSKLRKKLQHPCFTSINLPRPEYSGSIQQRSHELTTAQKGNNTLESPESISKSKSVSTGSRKCSRSEVSKASEEEQIDSDDEDDEDEETGGSNQGGPNEKTIAAHDKAAEILGPGAGPHPRGRCVKCVKGKHECVVNPKVGSGNTCNRCAKNKEKCSHQEYLDGQWIRENGRRATRQCRQCLDKASRGLSVECYQTGNVRNDKSGKACSQCHIDGTKNRCSLKEPPKPRPPKIPEGQDLKKGPDGHAPKKQKK